jgi:hypothetical protein
MRILGSELEGVVKTVIWLIHVHAHFLGWISPKLNLVVNGDDGETATRKWAWTWISQMTVLTSG